MTGPGVYRRSDPESWDPDRPRSAEEYLANNRRRRLRREQRADAIILRLLTFSIAFFLFAILLVLLAGCAEGQEPAVESTQAAAPAVTELAAQEPVPGVGAEPDPAEYLAKTVWGEARGCSTAEQAAVVWCVLNRVDSESFPDDIISVVTQPSQFAGYDPDNPVMPELLALAEDVLSRRSIEESCVGGVGRVLPAEYLFFTGDGQHNYFRTEYIGGQTWDWSLPDPYED